jgi:hypothetical protein
MMIDSANGGLCVYDQSSQLLVMDKQENLCKGWVRNAILGSK